MNGIACLKNTTCFISDFENRRIIRLHYMHGSYGVFKELEDWEDKNKTDLNHFYDIKIRDNNLYYSTFSSIYKYEIGWF